MEGVKCYCDLIAEVNTSHSRDNPNRIYYKCPKPLKAEKCKFWSWAEDLPPTQHMGTPSQTPASSPLKNMKRDASSIGELSNLFQLSPSQKRRRLIEAALAEDGGSSGLPTSSPNASTSNAALQPSPVGLDETRSAKRSTTYSRSPSPELFELRSQRFSNTTAKDDSTAYPFGPGEVNPESVGNMIKVLENTPDYVRKLDRKRIAAEKSLDVRNRKIEYLEDEVKRLKDRQKELELIIAGYESKQC